MTDLPASGYWSDNSRTEGEQKQWGEDIRDFINQMIGGGLEEDVTISSGSVTPSRAIISVDTEGATASDTLDAIAQANFPEGSTILVRAANASRVVTINHNAGVNGAVLTKSDANIDLVTDQFLWLKRTGTTWEEVSQLDSKLDALPRDIIPDADGTRDLGSASVAWGNMHADKTLTDELEDRSSGNVINARELYFGPSRAWGYFDDDASIFESFNVSSTTDNGTGDYTIFFTRNMSSANYAAVASAEGSGRVAHVPTASRGTTGFKIETHDFDANSENQQFSVTINGELA